MMPAVLAIWRQSVAERRAMGNLGLTWCLLALFVLATLSWRIDSPQRRLLFSFFTAVPMGALALMWWTYLCQNVRLQCHPAAMALVPGLRHRVVQAVLLGWAMIVAIMTLLAGMPTGHAPQVALVTALILVELSYTGTWRGMVLGLAVCIFAISKFLGVWLVGFLATPAALIVGVPLLVLDGAMALRQLGVAAPATAMHPVFGGFASPGRHGAGGRAGTRFDRGRDPQPAFLQPLGRSWFGIAWLSIVPLALVCAFAHAVVLAGTIAHPHWWFAFYRGLVALCMLGALAATAWREAQRFASARTEQALLCLTPGAPDPAAMNRILARVLLTGFLRCWLVLWLVLMAAQVVLHATWPELARLSAVWIAALGLLVFPLRDFARADGGPGFMGALCCAMLGAAGAVAVSSRGHPLPWVGLACAGLLCAALFGRWRWQVMLRAAPALPAGRVQDNRVLGQAKKLMPPG